MPIADDDGSGVHSEPDCEKSGDVCDGDQASQDQDGIRDSAHSISDHQLDSGLQQCHQCRLWHPNDNCAQKENIELHLNRLPAHRACPHYRLRYQLLQGLLL